MGLTNELRSSFRCPRTPSLRRQPLDRNGCRRGAARSTGRDTGLEFRNELLYLKRALQSSLEPALDDKVDNIDEVLQLVTEGILPERVLLVGVARKRQRDVEAYSLEESLEELTSLASTAGLRVIDSLYQQVEKPSPSTYVRAGKLEEIEERVKRDNISTVIFDTELTPVQSMNIEKALGDVVRICDRTALTLDIFSQHAFSKEGKLQVELARCQYQLPRLTRMWTHLERQVGGAGGDRAVKGMGEKQIEIDKRLLRKRMASLTRELDEVKLQRRLKRNRRADCNMPVVALVGYTNAGKSSLLNVMTEADVLVEDKLFATLDPTTRRLKLPSGKMALISDTVGFIQRLPPQLIAAFGATLEELLDATLLIHVVDVTSPQREKQQAAVMAILEAIGARHIPLVTAWNKTDGLTAEDQCTLEEAAGKLKDTCCISAITGFGLEALLSTVEASIEASMVPMHLVIPYTRGDIVRCIHDYGIVKKWFHDEEGTYIEASVPIYLAARLKPYFTDSEA